MSRWYLPLRLKPGTTSARPGSMVLRDCRADFDARRRDGGDAAVRDTAMSLIEPSASASPWVNSVSVWAHVGLSRFVVVGPGASPWVPSRSKPTLSARASGRFQCAITGSAARLLEAWIDPQSRRDGGADKSGGGEHQQSRGKAAGQIPQMFSHGERPREAGEIAQRS